MPKKCGRPPKRQAPEAEVPESTEAAEAPEIAGRFLNVLSADLLEDVGRRWIDIFFDSGCLVRKADRARRSYLERKRRPYVPQQLLPLACLLEAHCDILEHDQV